MESESIHISYDSTWTRIKGVTTHLQQWFPDFKNKTTNKTPQMSKNTKKTKTKLSVACS